MMEGLLTQEEREKLGTFEEGNRGDYHEMLHYLDTLLDEGLKNGRFTREEVEQDLEMALWVAYACNNIDTYEHYYLSVQWLARVEEQARQAGSGVWHYRYACALLYCGRPEKALEYAERGVRAQPAYPWCWLLLARLRSHFGDRKGALQANAQGKFYAIALDVYEKEPLPDDSPIWSAENILATPHTVMWSENYFERCFETVYANFAKYVKGETLNDVVDFAKGY